MAIIAGAGDVAQSAQALDVGVVLGEALRLERDHFFDDRVEVGAPPSGLVASQSRKASRKKCRSACWRPISRSSSAMRAFALASSSALGAADGPTSAAHAGSHDAPSAERGLHPTLRPRLRLSPATPIARWAARQS